jgi:hypothetical protein
VLRGLGFDASPPPPGELKVADRHASALSDAAATIATELSQSGWILFPTKMLIVAEIQITV